jgi:hypothetical protein
MLGPNGKAAAMQVHAAGAKRVDIMKSSICQACAPTWQTKVMARGKHNVVRTDWGRGLCIRV